ncbi:MAG: c-type cytochrome, partial [Gammaproteobacteria bacterium]
FASDQTSNALGKAIYNKTCVACHGINGQGVSRSFPDFTQKGGVLSQPYNVLFNNIIHGIGGMPPKGGYPALTDKEIKASLDYIMSNFAPSPSEAGENDLQELQQLKQQVNDLSQKIESLETRQVKTQNKNVQSSNIPSVSVKATAQNNNATQKNSSKVQTNQNKAKSSSEIKNNTYKESLNPQSSMDQNTQIESSYFWANPDISGIFTGGASVGYSNQNHNSGSFNLLDFNPLFLFRYKDLLLMQSSVDFSLDNDGNTNVSLNTLNLNAYLNDFMILGAGEYDSPLGYFVQNLSPAWINRLPNVPVGFDSDEAAPQSELGLQLRGGFYLLSKLKMNYTAFFANGPRAFTDSTTGLIDYIGTDAFPKNYGNFMGGGRLGILPIPDLEIGFSAATGRLALFDVSSNLPLAESGRGYSAFGTDFSYKVSNLELRAEVIKQLVSSRTSSSFPQSASWKAWYLQAAYMIPSFKLEPVLRWGGYTSADPGQSQHQVAIGLDYWIAPSIALQAAYEINKGQSQTYKNENTYLIQLAFGY